MKRILYFLFICVCFLSFGCARRASEPETDKKTITVAVPAAEKEIISKYLNMYKHQSDVDFKIIDVSGDDEDIHRFYVSTCMDNKFNVDVYLMEDKWVSEFAAQGYIDEISLIQHEFIPSVREAITYKDKTYAMPWYADVFTQFTKRGSGFDNQIYIGDGAEDYVLGVYSLWGKSKNLLAAVDEYEKSEKINNAGDFLGGNYSRAKGWLGQYNIMKEQNIVKASDVSIGIDENALLKTKVLAIRKGTKYKKEAQEVFELFLTDPCQKSLMTDIIAVPVLKSFYERDDLYDITPHILKISGMNFTRLKADEQYNADIKALGMIINQEAADTAKKAEIIGRLINE